MVYGTFVAYYISMETITKIDGVELICPCCQTSDYLIFTKKNTSEGFFYFDCKCEDCGKLFAYKVHINKWGRNQSLFRPNGIFENYGKLCLPLK